MAYAPNSNYGSNTVVTPRVDTDFLNADDFLADRDIMKAVLPNWDDKNLIGLLELTNRTESAKNTTFYHFETGTFYRTVKIATVKAGATAASATITLTADSYTAVGSLQGSVSRSPLKATDVVMLAPGIEAYVVAKTSPTPISGSGFDGMWSEPGSPSGAATEYTLIRRDNDTTTNLATLLAGMVTSGAPFAIPTNAHAEGSYQPIEGPERTATKYMGRMQIFKQHKSITGTADGLVVSATLMGKTKVWNQMVPDMLWKHRADIAFSYIFSEGGSYTNSKGEKVYRTESLESKTKAFGNNYSYDKSAGFTLTDLDAIVAKIKATQGGTEFWLEAGYTLASQFRAVVRSLTGGNGSVVYNNWGSGDAQKKKIDLGINSVEYEGITFHIQEMSFMNFPNVTDIFDYAKRGYLIPAESERITYVNNGMQTVTRNIDTCIIRYLNQSNGESRRFKEKSGDWTTNGGKDELSHDLLSEEGLQMTSLRKFHRIFPV